MDLNGLIAPALTFVLGIAAVGTFLGKFLPMTKKYIKIAKEATQLLDEVVTAIEDKEVSALEIEQIRLTINDLVKSLK